MKRISLRGRVRAAARELHAKNFSRGFEFGELSDALGIQDRAAEKKLHQAVKGLVKGGDLVKTENGFFKAAADRPPGAPGKEEVMWRFLRLNRQADAAQLMALAGAAQGTVAKFGARLVKRSLAVKTAGGWRLIQDPGPEPPFDDARADRARRWREKQREALAKLDAAWAALAEARMAVSQMEP